MPTVTSAPRPEANNEAFQQPKKMVKASTGMNMPPLKETKPVSESAPAPELGQKTISKEDTSTTKDSGQNAVTLSPKLTALARKEQKLQQDIQALRDKEAALTAKEKDYIPKSSIKEKMENNAIQALAELGYSYDEITNLVIAQQSKVDPAQEALKKLESKIETMEETQKQNVSKQYEATVNQYKKEIATLIDKDENYSTVKELSKQDAVLEHLIETFNEDGIVLSVDEAAKDIEEFLIEEATKMANLTKIKSKLAPPPEPKKLPPPKTGLRTLTTQVSSTPERTFNQSQHLSMKQRIEQAIAKAQK
jgi:hypothetical protein